MTHPAYIYRNHLIVGLVPEPSLLEPIMAYHVAQIEATRRAVFGIGVTYKTSAAVLRNTPKDHPEDWVNLALHCGPGAFLLPVLDSPRMMEIACHMVLTTLTVLAPMMNEDGKAKERFLAASENFDRCEVTFIDLGINTEKIKKQRATRV